MEINCECKECLHYDVCCQWVKKESVDNINKVRKGKLSCPHYKDKSLFVELPCAVGDIVHRVSFVNKKVETLKVEGFNRNLASWKVHCTHLIPTWRGNKKEHIYFSFSQIGKTVFLTEEEAKAKLKEVNNG